MVIGKGDKSAGTPPPPQGGTIVAVHLWYVHLRLQLIFNIRS